ncbi:MAG TPA: hypothetical protein ENG40_02655 [Thermoprotei archaeon]|nr:hypothetical protein [Thermoprotei archaeon]
MYIGFEETSITPPIGIALAGYYARKEMSKGIHDQLYARSIYIGEKDIDVIIISLDILGITGDLRDKIVEEIEKRTGIKNIVIASTHTHSGPDLYGVYEGKFKSYIDYLIQSITGIAYSSYINRKKFKEIIYAYGEAKETVVNRRNPYNGIVDPSIHALGFKENERKNFILNYTCHGVVMGPNNLYISADYPGAFVKYFNYLNNARSMFLNGACGNINPYTPGTILEKVYDRSVGTFKDVESMGRILAYEISRKLERPEIYRDMEIDFREDIVKLSIQKPPPLEYVREKYESIKKMYEKNPSLENLFKLRGAKHLLNRTITYKDKRYVDARIAVLKINKDIVLVFLPSEVFVEHQINIKKSSPFSKTIVVSYANQYFGYIPTEKAYDEGGYEVEFPTTILMKGEGEKLVENVVSLLRKL